MSSIHLTPSQRTLLTVLIDRIQATEDHKPVSADGLAADVDLPTGSIRNKMQHLNALQLVDGIPGPNGRYVPTGKANRALDMAEVENTTSVPVHCDGDWLPEATVTDIHLISINDADDCTTEGQVIGARKDVPVGTTVRIGPTPNCGITVEGIDVEREPDGTTVIVRV
jgi:predicted transcriptional regulator